MVRSPNPNLILPCSDFSCSVPVDKWIKTRNAMGGEGENHTGGYEQTHREGQRNAQGGFGTESCIEGTDKPTGAMERHKHHFFNTIVNLTH